MSVDPVRWGLLSTAHINRRILRASRDSALAPVVAVASRTDARAVAYAREHGIDRAHGSYEGLLADPDVDAVYVSLPNHLHHEWSMRALVSGKHVLCEKPYSMDPADVEEGFDLADSAGLVLSEAFMYRYNPQIIRATDLVVAGQIGELRLIRLAFSWKCDDPTDIRLEPTLDGGALADVGCYCVSAARLFAGEPTTVVAGQDVGPTGVDVLMAGVLRFDRGVIAHFDCGLHLPYRAQIELVGTDGSVGIRDPWVCRAPGLEVQDRAGATRIIQVPVADSYRLELEAFAHAVAGVPSTILGRADALGQARTVAALRRAADTGAPVAL